MKRLLLLLPVLFAFCTTASAQNYDQSLGLRGGPLTGLTYKTFIGGNAAVELLAATRWRGGLELTGLYELHNDLDITPGLQWYYGAGAHVGFWRSYVGHPWWTDAGSSAVVIGVDGIIGVEYTFEDYPINVSLDWKPEFNLIGYRGLWGDEGALSVRYCF